MNELAVIFGHGGHAAVLAALLYNRYSLIRYVVDDPDGSDDLAVADILARPDEYRSVHIYLGVGDNELRARWFDLLGDCGLEPQTCVADRAVVAHNAELGAGAQICAGAVIGARARVGRNVIVNTLSSVDHDCAVGDHTQLTAGVNLGGAATIGRSCLFGIRSATVPGVSVGDHTQVMAGALVTADAPERVVLGGCPARIVRKLE